MSQNNPPFFKGPPSRRGTPSTNGPIPYFSSPNDAAGLNSTDFFSSIGASHAPSGQMGQQPQQQYQQPYSQYPYQYQQQSQGQSQGQGHVYNQTQTLLQSQLQPPQVYQPPAPADIPPRSATGPAVEYPYQEYGYAANTSSYGAHMADPYRSASVVHSGMQYGAQYGYQNPSSFAGTAATVPAVSAETSGADFFDQLAGNSTNSLPQPQSQANAESTVESAAISTAAATYQSTGHAVDSYNSQYQDPANTQTAGMADGFAQQEYQGETNASNGVVFDQTSGQYYDTNTGQYFDEASGTWYYPQQPIQPVQPAQSINAVTAAYEETVPAILPSASALAVAAAATTTAIDSTAAYPSIAQQTAQPSQQAAPVADGASFFDDLANAAEPVPVGSSEETVFQSIYSAAVSAAQPSPAQVPIHNVQAETSPVQIAAEILQQSEVHQQKYPQENQLQEPTKAQSEIHGSTLQDATVPSAVPDSLSQAISTSRPADQTQQPSGQIPTITPAEPVNVSSDTEPLPSQSVKHSEADPLHSDAATDAAHSFTPNSQMEVDNQPSDATVPASNELGKTQDHSSATAVAAVVESLTDYKDLGVDTGHQVHGVCDSKEISLVTSQVPASEPQSVAILEQSLDAGTDPVAATAPLSESMPGDSIVDTAATDVQASTQPAHEPSGDPEALYNSVGSPVSISSHAANGQPLTTVEPSTTANAYLSSDSSCQAQNVIESPMVSTDQAQQLDVYTTDTATKPNPYPHLPLSLASSHLALPSVSSTASANWSQVTERGSSPSVQSSVAPLSEVDTAPTATATSGASLTAVETPASIVPTPEISTYGSAGGYYSQEPAVSHATAAAATLSYESLDTRSEQQPYDEQGLAQDYPSQTSTGQPQEGLSTYADDSAYGYYSEPYPSSDTQPAIGAIADNSVPAIAPVESQTVATAAPISDGYDYSYGASYGSAAVKDNQQVQNDYWAQQQHGYYSQEGYQQEGYQQEGYQQEGYQQQEYAQQDPQQTEYQLSEFQQQGYSQEEHSQQYYAQDDYQIQQAQQTQQAHVPSYSYPGAAQPIHTSMAANGYYDPVAAANALPGTQDIASVGIPTISAAPMGEAVHGSFRAASSMSGPLIPPPPVAAAVFDMHNQSERTSTDMTFYDRDASAAMQEYQQQQAPGGIHDPLGRLGACRPIVTFGFGGKLVTMFPQNVQRFNVYDSGKASKVAPGMLQIDQLSSHIPPELCGQGAPSLMGVPLLAGETTRAALLKRRDAAVACASTWLESFSSELPLITAPSLEERAMYKVLIALLGTFDQADSSKQPSMAGVLEALRPLFAQPAHAPGTELAALGGQPPLSHGTKQQLEEIETLLLSGSREQAVDFACKQGLWTHALIIASCTGKDLWQSVISAYTEGVCRGDLLPLGTQYRMFSGLGATALDRPLPFEQRNQAKTANAFVTAADIGTGGQIHTDAGYQQQQQKQQKQHGLTDGFPVQASDDSENASVENWAKILSLMLANRTPKDQGAMMELGDRLKSSGRFVEAHICYMLTQQSKDLFVAESADVPPRAILFGINETVKCHSDGVHSIDMAKTRYTRYYRKHSAIFATELYELFFALRAATAAETQPAAASSSNSPGIAAATTGGPANGHGSKSKMLLCLPHLQAYKLYHAWWLVDCGQVALASRYCDAVLSILATLPQGMAVPFINNSLVQELRNLRERLSGSGMTSTKAAEIVGDDAAIAGASSKSWLSRAMPRPSFTSLMTVFDSSIDKFITGADGNKISLEAGATPGKFEVGPDRQGSQPHDDYDPQSGRPPRPLGAVTWDGRTPSPHISAVTAVDANTGSGDMFVPGYSSPRQSLDGRPSFSGVHRNSNPEPPRMFTPSNLASQPDSNASGFTSYATPPAQQQQQQQYPVPPQWGDPGAGARGVGQGGFTTPGASFVPATTASIAASRGPSFDMGYHGSGAIENTSSAPVDRGNSSGANNAGNAAADDDDEEDMFGFSKKLPAAASSAQGPPRASTEAPRSSAPSARPSTDTKDGKGEDKGQGEEKAGGVFGIFKSLWGVRKNQANLGEESQFVYDTVLKKWVNKNATEEQKDSGPPPPPPPSMMKFQPHSSSVPPAPSAAMSNSPPGPSTYGSGAQPAITGPMRGSFATGGGSVPPPTHGGMAGVRPASTFPQAMSADPSRSGTPGAGFDSMPPAAGGLSMPPASTGARQPPRRRGARSKYVDLVAQ
ncbi:hypothetical protein GGI07_005056 [Coemansia sp. Benny D115]|nr:hypothetical protein GGI07_005056 [Coemansia sp. Benny D115]